MGDDPEDDEVERRPETRPPSQPPPSEYPPDDDDDDEHPEAKGRRRKLEKLLRDGIRGVLEKGLEAGLGTIKTTDKVMKSVVGGELPREVVGYIFSQVDDTKNALVRVVAGEVRDFLQATDLASELQKALTSLSFEIKTEIRFIPNDAGKVTPDVKARIRPRRHKKGDTEPEELAPSPDDEPTDD